MLSKNLTRVCIFASLVSSALANDNFLVISDIHLDVTTKHKMQFAPNTKTIKNDLDQTTFLSLIQTTQKSIHEGLIKKPNFILILGDIHGHKRLNNDLIESQQYVFTTLHNEFADTPIIYVFGNNDSPQKNYGKFTTHKLSPYLVATQRSKWKNGFLNTGKICKNAQSFPCINQQNTEHGYFSAMLKPKLRLISLNSVIFSISNLFRRDAKQELVWLQEQLNIAARSNEQVIIAMHIPPGYNTYNNEAFWRRFELKEFKKIINQYPNTIIGMLSSHTHQEEIKIYNHRNQKLGIYATAALSTAYGNSPSIKTFDLQKSNNKWQLQNYTTYKFSFNNNKILPSKVYDFQSVYCRKSVADINQCLDNVTIEKIYQYMSVNNPNIKSIINAPKQIYLAAE